MFSASEIADTIEKLKNDSLMLSRAMEKAERLQKYVNMGSEGFKSLMATAQANRTRVSYSLPKQRWLNAVHRVILQNCVQKVRERIDAFEDKARKKMNDALILAINVADARTESAINPLSPRLTPITSRVGPGAGAGGSGSSSHLVGSSGAKSARDPSKSTRARRQTTETPNNVKKEPALLDPILVPGGSHANPLSSLFGGAGASVSAAASAAAGSLAGGSWRAPP